MPCSRSLARALRIPSSEKRDRVRWSWPTVSTGVSDYNQDNWTIIELPLRVSVGLLLLSRMGQEPERARRTETALCVAVHRAENDWKHRPNLSPQSVPEPAWAGDPERRFCAHEGPRWAIVARRYGLLAAALLRSSFWSHVRRFRSPGTLGGGDARPVVISSPVWGVYAGERSPVSSRRRRIIWRCLRRERT
jgi:hypothetical protein